MAPRTARRVTTFVHVTNPDTGEAVVLGPGDEVPRWADKLVTNPKCFAQAEAVKDSAADSTDDTGAPAPAAPKGRTRTSAKGKAAAAKPADDAPAGDEQADADDAGAPAADGDGDDDGADADGADDAPPTFTP